MFDAHCNHLPECPSTTPMTSTVEIHRAIRLMALYGFYEVFATMLPSMVDIWRARHGCNHVVNALTIAKNTPDD